MTSYVYSMDAARARLKRGAKTVLVFLPYSGYLLEVTKENWKESLKTFRRACKRDSNL